MTDYNINVCFSVKLPHNIALRDALTVFGVLQRCVSQQSTEAELLEMGIDARQWDIMEFNGGFVAAPGEWSEDSLLISTAGSIDITVLSFFLQTLVKRWMPTGFIAFEFACDVSEEKEHGYGGGAVFITATRWEVYDTRQWIQEKFSAFQTPTPPEDPSPRDELPVVSDQMSVGLD